LDEWVQKQSDDYPPYLARAIHLQAIGWARRGGKWARETSREQFDDMEFYFTRAMEDLDAAERIEPECLVIFSERIIMYRALGDRVAIEHTYQRALEIQHLSFIIHTGYLATLLPRWGGSYRQMAKYLRESVPLFQENPKLTLLMGRIDWDKGRVLASNERYSDAIARHSKALSFGEYQHYFNDRGYAYYRSGDYDSALKDYQRALAIAPQDPDLFFWSAWVFYRMERLAEAVDCIEKAIALDPGKERYLEWRNHRAMEFVSEGHKLYEEQKLQEAIENYNRAEFIGPSHAWTYYWRGQALLKLERYDEARVDYEKAIRLDPGNIDAHRSLDWIFARRRQWDQVISLWNRFIVSHPDNADAYLERAGAYRHKGDMQSAMTDLEQSCRLGNQKACEYRKRYH
jgi:tetratricopeptide (TPR) repeat protein